MELIRGLHNLRSKHRGCVATIGSFDGVHLGHQAVLSQLAACAAELELPATLVTFEPHPREYFQPQAAPARLTRLREKLEALREYNVQRVLVLPFNDCLAGLTAAEFIRVILLDGLGVQHLVIGDDFRFGKDRAGDFALLQQAGASHGFPVVNMESYHVGNQRVSSTRIRESLREGDLVLAESLLGRPYGMCGRIAHGDKRGRTIGFPTANIHLHRAVSPVAGVYAVAMSGVNAGPISGVANVGTRPTVDGSRSLLEVHLFDFDRDIYGAHVAVSFLKKLRDEQRFDSFDELQQQIRLDAANARMFFNL